MGELDQLSGADVVRALRQLGFQLLRQRGSHVILRRDEGSDARGCVVPMHKRIALGTLLDILKQAGISKAEFQAKL